MSELAERELPVATGLMTPSSGEYIARLCGQQSLRQMRGAMPHDAFVLDVGSGLSDLGNGLAERSDLTVVDYDIQYADKAVQLKPLKELAPTNMTFMTGAASQLSFPDQVFDRVFSYNLLSHLMRDNPELAHRSLLEMLRVTKPSGEVWIGPTNGDMSSKRRWGMLCLKATASADEIEAALQRITAPKKSGRIYHAMAASGVGIYPRERFEPGKKGILLSDSATDAFHQFFSLSGLRLAAKLAKATLSRS